MDEEKLMRLIKRFSVIFIVFVFLYIGFLFPMLSLPYQIFNWKYGGNVHGGNVSLEAGESTVAIAHYDVAIQEDQSNYEAYCLRGKAYHKLVQPDQLRDYADRALKDYTEGLDQIASVKKSWLRIGHWYYSYHRPIEHECLLDRGKLHRDKNNRVDAISDFESVVEIYGTAEVYYFLAEALEREGDLEGALSNAHRAVQMDSGNRTYQELQQRLFNR